PDGKPPFCKGWPLAQGKNPKASCAWWRPSSKHCFFGTAIGLANPALAPWNKCGHCNIATEISKADGPGTTPGLSPGKVHHLFTSVAQWRRWRLAILLASIKNSPKSANAGM